MKRLLAVIFFAALVMGGFVYYQFNKAHRDTLAEKAEMRVSAVALFNDFITNEEEANKRYLDQVILVSGEVGQVNHSDSGNSVIVLKTNDDFFGVVMNFEKEQSTEGVKVGDQINIKGHCTGYSLDVTCINCLIIK